MKTFIMTVIAVFIYISAYSSAYSQTIPSAVTDSFNKKFPDVTAVKWDKENKHEYEASFKTDGIKYSANFADTGEWLETETGTSFNKLPQKVQDAFNTSHKGHKVKASSLIETSQGVTKYEIEYKSGSKTIETFYDDNGNSIKE